MNYPVAVIIPVYKNDTPQYVRPAIDSIIKQTYSCRIYILSSTYKCNFLGADNKQ